MRACTRDHVHIRTRDPEATAQWFEGMLGAEILRSMQEGKPRIDLKLGGTNIFIAPVTAGDGVNPPPTTPYQGLDHFGLSVSGIDAIAAEISLLREEVAISRRLDLIDQKLEQATSRGGLRVV